MECSKGNSKSKVHSDTCPKREIHKKQEKSSRNKKNPKQQSNFVFKETNLKKNKLKKNTKDQSKNN